MYYPPDAAIFRSKLRPVAHSASTHSSLVTANVVHWAFIARCQHSTHPAMPLHKAILPLRDLPVDGLTRSLLLSLPRWPVRTSPDPNVPDDLLRPCTLPLRQRRSTHLLCPPLPILRRRFEWQQIAQRAAIAGGQRPIVALRLHTFEDVLLWLFSRRGPSLPPIPATISF